MELSFHQGYRAICHVLSSDRQDDLYWLQAGDNHHRPHPREIQEQLVSTAPVVGILLAIPLMFSYTGLPFWLAPVFGLHSIYWLPR